MTAYHRRLFLHRLEGRTAPAVFTVTNTLDAGAGSLRDAITFLNLSTDPANTIDATGVSGTITLASALPAIAKPVTLVGPGTGKLTVSGNNAFQVFKLAGTGVIAVTFSDLTITAGKSTTDGGAIFSGDESLTLNRVNVTYSTSSTEGGGIATGFNGVLVLDSCTVSGNTGTTGGGVYFLYNGRFDIRNSTISNNKAVSETNVPGGGGLYFFGIAKDGVSSISNTTISGNTADAGAAGNTQGSGGGGICLYQATGDFEINNCTIVNNTVTANKAGQAVGGGIAANFNFTTGATINFRSSIIAGNTSPGGVYPDLFIDFDFTVISSNSAYASNPASNGAPNFKGTLDQYAFNPATDLAALADNGGPTLTHALKAGSTAINAGINAGPCGVDQRGPTYARKVGATVDIGAFEFGAAPGTPTGNLANLRLTAPGGTSQAISVLFADDSAVETASLGTGDMRVTGPGGYNTLAAFIGFTLDPVLGAKRVTANYSFPANSLGNAAKWDGNDNGVYTIAVEPGQVADAGDNFVTADAIANLSVVIPLPTATASAPTIKSAQLGTTTNTITAVYTHLLPIAFASLDNADIRVTGPGGYNQLAVFKNATPGADSTTITATYEITAPGGTWDVGDAGHYAMTLEPSQVNDTDGVFVPPGQLGQFAVSVPQTFVVNAINDEAVDTDGKLSLREAVQCANINVADAADTIAFDAAVFAGATTITLNKGRIPISDGVVITGPGSSKLTLDTKGQSRHLDVDGPGAVDAKISGMTFINGVADTDGYGGAIRLNPEQESLSVADCVFKGNASSSGGGAIGQPPNYLNSVHAALTVTGCLFEDNTAGGQGGGALHMNSNSGGTSAGPQLKVVGTAFRGNVATSFYGGAIFMRMSSSGIPASLFVDACEFSANINETGYGGAIGLRTGMLASTSVTLRNSTFFDNHAAFAGSSAGGGSALALSAINGSVFIQNCTMTRNVSSGVDPVGHYGGAISVTSGAPTVTVESSIIFDNPSADFPGAQVRGGGGKFTFINSCLGSKISITNYVDGGGNLPIGTDPLLGTLAENGGPTRTVALLSGSPARNVGSNPAGLAFDQRGFGFPRVLQGVADMGAVETNDAIPNANAAVQNVLVGDDASYVFSVSYEDDVAIKVTSLGTGDVTVTGPSGFSVTPTFLGVDVNSDGTPRIATYGFTPPGGFWDKTDNGTYMLSMAANQVTDGSGNSVPAGPLGSFNVGVPDTFVVTNANDSGPGSLRQAVLSANALIPSQDSITFDPTFFATAKTISLSTGPMSITDAVIVIGPGAAKVNVAGGSGQIFTLNGPSGFKVTMSDMTLSGASSAGDGGAVNNATAVATFNGMVFDGNTASGNGGAIYANGGQVNVNNSTFSKNTSGASGGAVTIDGAASGTFTTVTFSANSSAIGGGIGFINGGILVESSLFLNNIASADGGGIGTVANPIVGTLSGFVVRNSTFSGNEAANTGGAIQANQLGTLFLQNSTVTKSKSSLGAVYHLDNNSPPGFVNIESSIITDNITTGTEANVNFSSPLGSLKINKSAVFSVTGPFNGTGNLAAGTNYKLNPTLADNGGPTLTHALLPGSPAIDAGSNPANLTFDQRGPGYLRVANKQADIGAFEVQVPHVLAVTVNGGAAQRSRVTGVTVTFDQPVGLPVNPADAFALKRQSDNAAVGVAAVVAGNVVTLTFTGGPIEFGSLADGRYTLTVFAAQVNAGQFDGDGDGVAGGDYVLVGGPTNGLFRLFGDNDGDGDMDAPDFGAFRMAFGTASNLALDFDNDGDVDAVDFSPFRQRFGTAI